ncbi:T9SS type A sorting domain-containing protein [uncultured Polaribacter sp.]|uniref:NHL domain-containing protein n=1 Tax=uncultured Polaribacter sp. TaxID=174711 RepID=UPI002616EA34|nr:T9SS type A sorting domain-containing protein [uncultured Polaribacter sp.]
MKQNSFTVLLFSFLMAILLLQPIAARTNETSNFSTTFFNTSPPTGNALFIYNSTDKTLADITATLTGTGIKWYNAPTDGVELDATTSLVSGDTYYATQTIDGIESVDFLAVKAHDVIGSTLRFNVTNYNPVVFMLPSDPEYAFPNRVVKSVDYSYVNVYETSDGTTPLDGPTELAEGTYYVEEVVYDKTFAEFAGSYIEGYEDGPAKSAKFSFNIEGIITDSQNNIYINDVNNYAIRKISPTGEVSTLAGNGTQGNINGIGSDARFYSPYRLTINKSTNDLYVTDYDNINSKRIIKKITPEGEVSEFNLNLGGISYLDNSNGMVFDSNGNLFYSVYQKIYKITPSGDVTVFAGDSPSNDFVNGNGTDIRFKNIQSIVIDSQDNLFVADGYGDSFYIRKITPAGDATFFVGDGSSGYTNGTGTETSFSTGGFSSMVVDSEDNIFFWDSQNRRIRKITPSAEVTNFIGNGEYNSDAQYGEDISIGCIQTMGISTNGSLLTSCGSNIRKLHRASNSNRISIIIEKYVTKPTGDEAPLYLGTQTIADLSFNRTNIKWYDAETGGSEIPTTTLIEENTSYFASQTVREVESEDRTEIIPHKLSEATQTFNTSTNPTVADLVATPKSNATVSWYNSSTATTALELTTALQDETYYLEQLGEGVTVTTIAGNGERGDTDATIGTEASFASPKDLVFDSNGNLFVTDSENHRIRKISPSGAVTTFAGSTRGFLDATGTAAQFYSPSGITIDASDNLYVTDKFNHSIRKITPTGVVTTVAGDGTDGRDDGNGTSAKFSIPNDLVIDSNGDLIVADTGNRLIRKVTMTGEVTTIAGDPTYYGQGYVDAQGTAAKFTNPVSIAFRQDGNLIILDSEINRVRMMTPDYTVSTIAGKDQDMNNSGPPPPSIDGLPADATFALWSSRMTLADDGTIYFTEADYNSKIRKILPGTNEVVTLFSKQSSGPPTLTDGTTQIANLSGPEGIALNAEGEIIIVEGWTEAIRKVELSEKSARFAVDVTLTTATEPPTMTSNKNGDWNDPTVWTVSGTAATTPSTTPTSEYDVVLGHVVTIPEGMGAATAKSIGSTTGAQLILKENNNLTVTEDISLDKSDDGMILYAQNGTTSTMTFGGTYLSGKKTTIIKRLTSDKWHLISSPFNITKVNLTTENSSTHLRDNGSVLSLASYDDSKVSGSKYSYFTNGTIADSERFGNGQGYSISVSDATTPDYYMTGDQHSGSISYTLSTGGNGFNLIGNPYISYIHANDAADATNNILQVNGSLGSDRLVEDTIWLWDADNETWITKTRTDTDGYRINPLQGFFVQAKSAEAFSFTKAMETNDASNSAADNTFLKSSNSKFEVVLSLKSGQLTRKASIRYIANTTTSFDNGYDGSLFGGYASALEVYTGLVAGNSGKKLAIQSLPNENYEDMVVPVGVTAEANSEIEFSAEALNIPSGYKVFLEDRANNTFTRLDEVNAKYTTTVADASTEGRFFLHTSMQSALSIEDTLLNSLSIYKSNTTTLRVVGLSQGEASVKLFNVMGKQVMSSSFNAQGVKEIALPSLSTGVYIVQLETEAGTLNKKIILE